jgi:hypothetical protein
MQLIGGGWYYKHIDENGPNAIENAVPTAITPKPCGAWKPNANTGPIGREYAEPTN